MRLYLSLFFCTFSIIIQLLLIQVDGEKSDGGESFKGEFITRRYKPIAINVDTTNINKCANPKEILFVTHSGVETLLINTGQSVQTTNLKSDIENVTGGPLKTTYHYLNFMYYWADTQSNGITGTTIDGEGFPYEVRVLYINPKYSTVEEAVKELDGLAEFVYVFRICSVFNSKFQGISNEIQKIKKAGSAVTVPLNTHVTGINFIPKNSPYYTYLGKFLDIKTGKKYRSSTVTIVKPNSQYCITQEQFDTTFDKLENYRGDRFTNTLKHDSTRIRAQECRDISAIFS